MIGYDLVAIPHPPQSNRDFEFVSTQDQPAWSQIAITSGASQLWYSIYQMPIDDVVAGEIWDMRGETSIRNDTGWNVEVACIFAAVPSIKTAPAPETATKYTAVQTNGISLPVSEYYDPIGRNSTPGAHYDVPQRTFLWIVPQDYERIWLSYRVRARCSAANGNQSLTVQGHLGRLQLVRTKP